MEFKEKWKIEFCLKKKRKEWEPIFFTLISLNSSQAIWLYWERSNCGLSWASLRTEITSFSSLEFASDWDTPFKIWISPQIEDWGQRSFSKDWIVSLSVGSIDLESSFDWRNWYNVATWEKEIFKKNVKKKEKDSRVRKKPLEFRQKKKWEKIAYIDYFRTWFDWFSSSGQSNLGASRSHRSQSLQWHASPSVLQRKATGKSLEAPKGRKQLWWSCFQGYRYGVVFLQDSFLVLAMDDRGKVLYQRIQKNFGRKCSSHVLQE